MYYDVSVLDDQLRSLNLEQLGIAAKVNKAVMNTASRSLIIGVGGMGLTTIRHLKKELRDRLGVIDETLISFLGLDTAVNDRDSLTASIFTKGEVPDIDNTKLNQILALDPKHRPQHINAVMSEDFNPQFNGQGANQVRLVGRLSLLEDSLFGQIHDAIQHSIAAMANFTQKKLDVHIIAGTGGGTGSGMIIDIPYIVRRIAEKLNISKNMVRIIGHIYLPNVYLRGQVTNLDAAYCNGYAALKEIDYYMSIKDINETFDVIYPAPLGPCSFKDNIFDQCTLIGGEIAANMVINNPKEAAVQACVAELVNQVTNVQGKMLNNTSGTIADFFTSDDFASNADRALQDMLSKGNALHYPTYGNYRHQIVGSASIKFPSNLIIEEFLGGVFEKAESKLSENVKMLSNADVEEFEAMTGNPIAFVEDPRQSNAIAQMIKSKFQDTNLSKGDYVVNKLDTTLGATIANMVERFDFTYAKNSVSNANNRARAIFTDPNKGPYFLEMLLTSVDIGGAGIRGYFQRVKSYKADLQNRLESLKASNNITFQNRSALTRKMSEEFRGTKRSNVEQYENLTIQLYVNEYKIGICSKLLEHFYHGENEIGIEKSLIDSLSKYFLAYVDIFKKSASISISNGVKAKTALRSGHGDIFELMDAEFDQLKLTIRNTATSELSRFDDIEVGKFIGTLTNRMVSDPDNWLLKDLDTKTDETFRQFVNTYERFDCITKKNMVMYLDEAYREVSTQEKNKVAGSLVSYITDGAKPMCSIWPTVQWNNLQTLCYQYLVIPSDWNVANMTNSSSGQWASIFESSFAGQNRNIYYGSDSNAIYSYKMYVRMPIWIHQRLKEYEDCYYSYTNTGVHINENPDILPPLKEYPPLFIKSQWFRVQDGILEYSNDKEVELRNRLEEDFKFGKEYGIIRKNSRGEYAVMFTEEKAICFEPGSDENLNDTIKEFIDDFWDDPVNGHSTANLYMAFVSRFKEKAKCRDFQIVPVNNSLCMPVDDDNTKELIRRQMKLWQKLREEIAFFKKVLSVLKERIGEESQKKQVQIFTKYMIYGLLGTVDGKNWTYKLADKKMPIVSARAINNDEATSWMSNFMEMAACEKFFSISELAMHRELLDSAVDSIDKKIDYAEPGFEQILNFLKNNAEGIKRRVMSVQQGFKMKQLRDESLSVNEKKAKEFYDNQFACLENFLRTI